MDLRESPTEWQVVWRRKIKIASVPKEEDGGQKSLASF